MTRPEFPRPLPITSDMGAGDAAHRFDIAADAEERAALARRFDLLALDRLEAQGTVEVFQRGRRARVRGTVFADVTQACVVTLAPVPARIEETFVRDFDRDAAAAADGETEIDVEADDPPDPLDETGIDLGEVAAEALGLALDPYPRAEGARLEAPGDDENRRESPFSALKRLKER